MLERDYGELLVGVAQNHYELGAQAAAHLAKVIQEVLAGQPEATIILSLGAAEDVFFAALMERQDIEWSRLTVLQVDAYLGIAATDPRSGAARLQRLLLDQVKPKAFHPMLGDTQPVEAELDRYTQLYHQLQPVVCVLGVGETGHLAFIDPPADFNTASTMVAVALAEKTRQQIAKAEIFHPDDAVPHFGLSLTVPALVAPKHVMALVHEADKAPVIRQALEDPVSIMCPASALRTKPGARLYLSREAAADLAAFTSPLSGCRIRPTWRPD